MPVEVLHPQVGINKISRPLYKGEPVTGAIANGLITVDQRWTVLSWNEAAEKFIGYTASEMIGKNLWQKLAPIIPLNFYSVYHKAFLQDIPVHFVEYWGELGVWFDVTTFHCNNTLSVSFKDCSLINFKTRPHNQLRILNDLYKYVSEVTNACLWEWNIATKEIFWIDGGHKRIFGYDIENALIPQSFWESRLHPEDKSRVLDTYNLVLEEKKNIWEIEYRFAKADGEFVFVHDKGHIIYDNNDNPKRMIGATENITSRVILENKITEERSSKQREITNAVLTAQENEREDIGKEMHDNLNQKLAVAKMYIEMARTDPNHRDIDLEKSAELIKNVIDEIRLIAKRLVLPGINIIGIIDNIKNLVHDITKTNTIKIAFVANGIDKDLIDEKLQLTIFRIAQEQFNNILKHSKASQAIIELTADDKWIKLTISDNGIGCVIDDKIRGVGLINIRSRTHLHNGSLQINSKPGEGFEIKAVLSNTK